MVTTDACPHCGHRWDQHYQPNPTGPAAGLTCLAYEGACRCRTVPPCPHDADTDVALPDGWRWKADIDGHWLLDAEGTERATVSSRTAGGAWGVLVRDGNSWLSLGQRPSMDAARVRALRNILGQPEPTTAERGVTERAAEVLRDLSWGGRQLAPAQARSLAQALASAGLLRADQPRASRKPCGCATGDYCDLDSSPIVEGHTDE